MMENIDTNELRKKIFAAHERWAAYRAQFPDLTDEEFNEMEYLKRFEDANEDEVDEKLLFDEWAKKAGFTEDNRPSDSSLPF